jgi:MFS family permease
LVNRFARILIVNALSAPPPGPHGTSSALSATERIPPARLAAVQRKRTLATSFRLCTSEGLVAMPLMVMALPVNIVLSSYFTKALALPNQAIGIISALPFVCNFLQVGVAPLLSRWFPAKTISLVASCLHALSWAFFAGLLNFIPADDPANAALWIGLWFFVSSFALSITSVSWNAWIQEWVPVRLRGKYFGRRNRLLQFSTLTFFLLGGWVLAAWDYSRTAFQLVIAFALLLRVLSILWQHRMPTEASASAPERSATLAAQFSTLRRAPSFLWFIVFGAAWSFAANVFGPFYYVFMFKALNLSAFDVSLLSVCGATGAALSMPAWGQLLDRFGNKSVMTVSLLLWQAQNFGWCFLTPENHQWLYPMWFFGGLFNAGFFLGMFTLLLKLLPVPARNLALGVNLAVTSLFAAIAPVVGGALLDWAQSRWPVGLGVYHACFIVQPVLALGAAWLLLKIREPAAAPLTHVVGAMRNVRTLAALSGLSFLTSHVFYRTVKSPLPRATK